MPPLAEWCRRVWYLLNRRRFDDELLRDLEAHRERVDRPQRFGNMLRLREDARDAWGWRWLDDAAGDVRLSVRTLRRSPVFTATTVLILSLGIGVNLALFQLVNAALLRPLPIRDLDALVRFDHRGPTFSSNGVPYPMATFVEGHSEMLSAVFVRHRTEVTWGDQRDRRTEGAFVSANWFAELGGAAAAGRLLGAVDSTPGADAAVVISHAFWMRQLAGRPDAVGSTLRINDRPATVVGITSADFPEVGIDLPSIWMPIAQAELFVPGSRLGKDWTPAVEMFARLRPGVSLEAVRTGTQSLLAAMREQDPARVSAGQWLEPAPGTRRFLSEREAQQVWIAAGAVTVLAFLVLVIACLNLSNLALARAMARVREMSIRVGLGAGRWRVVRHLLTESAVVAGAGSLGGVVLGLAAAYTVARRSGGLIRLDVTPDWRLALAMLGAAVFGMLAVGLIPAWKIGRSDLALATRDGGERVTHGLHSARLRYVLLTGQIAGSCLLLVVTAQLARSLQRALEPDPGFDYASVAVLDPSLVSYGFDATSAGAYWRAVRPAIEAQGEALELSVVSYAPLNGGGGNNSRYRSTPQLRVVKLDVEPSFFAVMRIPILAGRLFEKQDTSESAVIVSRRVAMEMYGTTDVIGRGFPKDQPVREIVGVAGDAHLVNPQAPDAAEAYMPLGRDTTRASLIVRARTDPVHLLAPLRQASRAAAARVLPDVRLMRDDHARLIEVPRAVSAIAGGVALLAVVLASLGIFGVVSHGARLRTKEVGIRLALGAPRASIMRTLVQRTVWAGGAGLLLGLTGAVALTRGLAGAPFFIEWRDPVTYLVGAAMLALAGASAAVLPTLGTLRADPLRALRME